MNDLIIFKTKKGVIWLSTSELLKTNSVYKLAKGHKRWVQSDHYGGIFTYLNDPEYHTSYNDLTEREQSMVLEFLLKL